ncbi:hypothetical protein [Avibacterium paragallinarum]|uniref:hypothetical protein n=1 Tax=Avibacterium paragallinarum TaxID=728 RepID=UPI002ED81F8A
MRKSNLIWDAFLCLRSFWERKRKGVANGETRYINKEKCNQPKVKISNDKVRSYFQNLLKNRTAL